MKNSAITRLRLHNQRISTTGFKTPEEVVRWLGAVQSQDYSGAKWAVALRASGLIDADVEQKFTEGKILRTHVLRPTWHFVMPEDIRWMLTLTAPRVLALLGYMDRQLDLDKTIIKKSNTALLEALKGGKRLTRAELESALQKSRINTGGLRLVHLMMHAELDAIICSGGRHGKQFTYALLDEQTPQTPTLERGAALSALASRYFISRGPATLQDFVWWSGLTTADARQGLDSIKSKLIHEVEDGQTYWFSDSKPKNTPSPTAYLLPNYDEFSVCYTDRSMIFDSSQIEKLDSRGSILFQNIIVMNGQITGTWKRTIKKNEVVIELKPFNTLTKTEKQAVMDAAKRYGKFLGLSVIFQTA